MARTLRAGSARSVRAIVLVVSLAVAGAGGRPIPAGAQEQQAPSPPSSTVAPGPADPLTTDATPSSATPPDPQPGPPGAGLPPVAPALDEASGEAVPHDLPPEPALVVPPDPTPTPLTAEQAQADAALTRRYEETSLALAVVIGLETQTRAEVAAAEAAESELAADEQRAGRRQRAAARALARERARVKSWAIAAYTGGGLRQVGYVLESRRINDVPRRIGLVAGVFGSAHQSLREQERDLEAATVHGQAVGAVLADTRSRLDAARRAAGEAAVRLAGLRQEVAALGAGREISVGGVAFPVAGAARYVDTFGAPRMAGTPYAHAHEGVDIFAANGTPVVAFERGVVDRLGTDVLGGTKLWLVGQSGTRYYYAHLQGYTPGLAGGAVVEAGQPLGFVGSTGNARGTADHLHFEVHPGGGPPVNPAPILDQILAAASFGLAAAGAVRPG